MRFRSLASSSAGNSYELEMAGCQLILEAGISASRIMAGFNFDLSRVQGVLVTHEHGDHACGVKELLHLGRQVYTSEGTARALRIQDHHGVRVVRPRSPFQLGRLTCWGIPVIHDALEPLGFLIQSPAPQLERALFITDSSWAPVKLKGVTHLLIECNFQEDRLEAAVARGSTPPAARTRIMASHMGLQGLLRFLAMMDTSRLQEVWILHTSAAHGDPERVKREVRAATGAAVYVCAK